jgi:general secretion pathway protein H
VLAIAASVAALAAPRFAAMQELLAVRGAAAELASALRSARAAAMARHRETAVVFDAKARSYGIPGARTQRLDPIVGLQPDGAIRFFADGSSSGGRVTLAVRRRALVVEVSWLTGRVAIHDP